MFLKSVPVRYETYIWETEFNIIAWHYLLQSHLEWGGCKYDCVKTHFHDSIQAQGKKAFYLGL